jgi:hypothetical protein
MSKQPERATYHGFAAADRRDRAAALQQALMDRAVELWLKEKQK